MKKHTILSIITIIFLSFCAFAFCACNQNVDQPTNEPDDNLIFFDDFDTLDTSIWNVYTKNIVDGDGKIVENGFGYEQILKDGMRKGGYWDKEQVFVENGNLIIRTVEKDGKYYTGAIDTDNKFETHFGYYETRVQLPKASGIWAAFWLMCDNMGKSSTDPTVCGAEIDIFESPYYNGSSSSKEFYQSALHMGDYGSVYKQYTRLSNASQTAEIEKIYDGWHTFALDWQEDYYRFYFDDMLMGEMTSSNVKEGISKLDDFLFLSVEIDGANGSAYKNIFPFSTSITNNEDGAFPADFIVDYVKVYKTKPAK